jgi:hypothetical protein
MASSLIIMYCRTSSAFFIGVDVFAIGLGGAVGHDHAGQENGCPVTQWIADVACRETHRVVAKAAGVRTAAK